MQLNTGKLIPIFRKIDHLDDSLILYNLYTSVGLEEIGINKSFIKTKEGTYLDVVDMTKIVEG